MSSSEYIIYPNLETHNCAYDSSIPSYQMGRWGTSTMGAPSNPQAHPDNQQAATWEPLSQGILHDDWSTNWDSWALKNTPASSACGYVTPPPSVQGNPYIATSAAPKPTGKGPKKVISSHLNRCSKKFEEVAKKAEEMAGNVWNHLRTGPNMADTIWGRLTQGAKVLRGGYAKVFKQTFETAPDEELHKYYACYLSTSSGPVSGTLYISTVKVAFCSDRPLSYQLHPGQTAWSYYMIVLPLDKLEAVNPSANQSNLAEKYIQIITVDKHEFWFMGFVNYDKAVKNLQKALRK